VIVGDANGPVGRERDNPTDSSRFIKWLGMSVVRSRNQIVPDEKLLMRFEVLFGLGCCKFGPAIIIVNAPSDQARVYFIEPNLRPLESQEGIISITVSVRRV